MTLPTQHEVSETTAQLDFAVAEVFDLMLGMTCNPIEHDVAFDASIAVSIEFHGWLEGSCRISLSHSAARRATEVLLDSCVPATYDHLIEDAAGELCNMIVGRWKSALPPRQASAILTLPIFLSEKDAMKASISPGLRRLYTFEGHLCAVALSVQNYLTTD